MADLPIFDAVTLTQNQVRCASVTPRDEGALDTLVRPLEQLGFTIYRLRFEEEGYPPIDNVFARRGSIGPHLCYMGHTDVVPAGRAEDWTHDPYGAVIENGVLYGRGVADMKGGNAAFVAAASEFLHKKSNFKGSISLLLTGDEEAHSVNGTVKVIDWMKAHGHLPDVALVGEPSNFTHMGENVRVGRRGSLTGQLFVEGVQGHSAYPERANNPVHHLVKLLHRLISEKFDEGTPEFPATHLVVASADVGNTASNVIPARAHALFNMRFNNLWTAQTLETHLRQILDEVGSPYTLKVRSNSPCFLTPDSPWRRLVMDSIARISGKPPRPDTGGGTSDARFMSPYCPVVEYGLLNATIHKVDERAPVEDIQILTATFTDILLSYFRDEAR
ncbi:MAG: succinyl-diaminopimelate desuccinylase [Pseudobdellovibrionaceae bacterium]